MHDQYDDPCLKELHGMSEVIELPERVKTAEVVDLRTKETKPTAHFADTANRKFPISSAEETATSALYFRKHAHEYTDEAHRSIVSKRISDAMNIWGVDPVVEKKAGMNKSAAAEEPMAVLTVKTASGVEQFKLNMPRDFEKAAIELLAQKQNMTFNQRQKIARQLVAVGAEQFIQDDSVLIDLQKTAGLGICSKEHALSVLKNRATLYSDYDDSCSEEIAKLAEELYEGPEIPEVSVLNKIAAAVDELDDKAKMKERHPLITPVENSIFVFTEKSAEDLKEATVRLITGDTFHYDSLDRGKLVKYFSEVLGQDVPEDRKEAIAILETLPVPEAEDFLRVFN
jgi:hypothetical protein